TSSTTASSRTTSRAGSAPATSSPSSRSPRPAARSPAGSAVAEVELGSDVLRTLDRGLGRLREAVAEIDGAVQTSSAALLRAGDAEVGGYRRLAELRLAELARGGVVQSLSAVSERVRAVLERREDELASLGRELEALERRLAELEAERERQR